MAKEIQYPTQEWLDKWVDKYIDENPEEKIDDFKALEEMAMEEWWDNEINHNRPTPFDLTKEQEADSKKARMGISAVDKTEKKERKPRERKADVTKIDFVKKILELAETFGENAIIVKPEREVSFDFGGENYSIQLVKHRKPKEK